VGQFFEIVVAVAVSVALFCLGYGSAYLRYRAPFEVFQKNVHLLKKHMISSEKKLKRERVDVPVHKKSVRIGNNVFECEVRYGAKKERRRAN